MRFIRKILPLLSGILLSAAINASEASRPVTGEVSADKLNVRIRPETAYSAVTVLKQGDKVKIISGNANWYCIEAPSDSAVWIGAAFIDHESGTVLKKAYLRAGPGITFESYETVVPGDRLTVLDKTRPNWVKVAVLPSLRAWVNKNYITVSPEEISKIETMEQAPVHPVQKEADTPEKAEKQEEAPAVEPEKKQLAESHPQQEPLPFIDEEAKITVTEGVIFPLAKDSKYVTHALAIQINSENYPIAYLHSENHNLSLWEKRKVRIKGLQRWVRDWKRPVLEVETISPSW